MRIMTTPELVEIMTTLYDNRLKALIGYQKTDFTREIIETMFQRFKEMPNETTSKGYKNYPKLFSDVLCYLLEPDGPSIFEAKIATDFFVTALDNYLRYNLVKLFPNWDKEYGNMSFRNVFGKKFAEILNESPDLFPEALQHHSMLSQLNYTTFYRNHQSHREVILDSMIFYRYSILYCYDFFLTFLLYTFYYMALDENYTIKHIK